jgi:hypothetical protein
MPALPLSPEELTAPWLSQALSAAFPGVQVIRIPEPSILWGTATKVRLEPEYAGNSVQGPSSLYVKAALAGPEQRRLLWQALRGEANFYGRWRPRLTVEAPQAWFAESDETTGQAVVVMEDLDLRQVRYGNPTVALTLPQVRDCLSLLANCHGRWWQMGELCYADAYPGMLASIADLFFSETHWARLMALPRGQHVPAALRDRSGLRRAWERMQALAQPQSECLVHGDAHPGNLYFTREGRAGFLDWQNTMHGPWAHDVAYLIATGLSVEDRRQHERELLREYLDALGRAGGGPPSFDEAWLRYRRHLAHPFCWVLTPETMQPEENCTAIAERICAAMTDLDCLQALADT